MNMKQTKKYVLPLVVIMSVLLAFSSPATADYSGDHPLTIYDHDTINGRLVYETVTDGSKYKCLYPQQGDSRHPFVFLYQDLTVNIPEGATVKMARLYNTYCWSCWGADDYAACPPAQARLTLTDTSTHETWSTGDLTHSYTPANRDECPNPIVYLDPVFGDVVHYWDTKSQNYSSKIFDFPSGTFAWDVTGLVTHSGTYNASIRDSRAQGRVGDERFVTFGFGLLVVYEEPSSPLIKYWIAEGCDTLMARNPFETPESATTSATFGSIYDATKADLTTVLTCSDTGTLIPPWNMIYFNGVEIGPSTALGTKHYGVNYFDVTSLLSPGENVVEFQDRGDCEYVHNAFLVVENPVIPASVTFDKKKLNLNSNGILKAFITLPDDCDVANIDVSTVECEGAPVVGSKITGKDVLEAKFGIQDLEGVEPRPEVKLTVKGELFDGTPFEGSNTVEVV